MQSRIGAVADPKAAETVEDEEADPGPYFCFCCDNADVTRCDEDRCCVECGMDLVPLSQMRELLRSAHGLHIGSEADRKVLEACSAIPNAALEQCDDDTEITPDWYIDLVRAELTRRKP
jgi:hypothetical protein